MPRLSLVAFFPASCTGSMSPCVLHLIHASCTSYMHVSRDLQWLLFFCVLPSLLVFPRFALVACFPTSLYTGCMFSRTWFLLMRTYLDHYVIFALLYFLDFLPVSYCSVFSLLFSQDGVLDQEEMVAHMELFTAGNKGYQSGQNIKQEL